MGIMIYNLLTIHSRRVCLQPLDRFFSRPTSDLGGGGSAFIAEQHRGSTAIFF